MKRLCFLLILLFPLAAAASEAEKHADSKKSPPLQQQQKKSNLQPEMKTASPPLHKRFQPSERIEADTVIAFPADI